MTFNKNILILEDNLKVLSKLLEHLNELEHDQPHSLSIMVLTNSQQVEDYINNNTKASFDVIILDRDCKLNGSFHVLDLERFGPEKVISISTVPEYNKEAQKRGVKLVVQKDISKLDEFAQEVTREVEKMISRKIKQFGIIGQ